MIKLVKPPRPPRDVRLGERLRVMREALGEKQAEFHAHFKVGRSTYIGYERYGVPSGPTSEWVRAVLLRMKSRKKDHSPQRKEYDRNRKRAKYWREKENGNAE